MSNHASQEWLQKVNAALGKDALRKPFVDDAVRLVIQERNAAWAELKRLHTIRDTYGEPADLHAEVLKLKAEIARLQGELRER